MNLATAPKFVSQLDASSDPYFLPLRPWWDQAVPLQLNVSQTRVPSVFEIEDKVMVGPYQVARFSDLIVANRETGKADSKVAIAAALPERAEVLPKKRFGWRDMAEGILKSPYFVYQDIKNHPCVSGALLAGLGAATFMNVLETVEMPLTIFSMGVSLWFYSEVLKKYQTGVDHLPEQKQHMIKDFGVATYNLAMIPTSHFLVSALETYAHHQGWNSDPTMSACLRLGAILIHFGDEVASAVKLNDWILDAWRTRNQKRD